MTSNLGTEYIQDKLQNLTEENRDSIMNEARLNIIELLRQRLRPEFLNRIDEIIFFKPLTKTDIRQIVMVQVKKLQAKLKAEDITLTLSNDALDWIANLGYDPQYGARPLKRAIQRYLADPLAIKLLSAEIASGDVINAEVNDIGGIEFNKQ